MDDAEVCYQISEFYRSGISTWRQVERSGVWNSSGRFVMADNVR